MIAPAVAGEPESTGYGLMRHTFYGVITTSSVTAVGVVAHSPSQEIGQEGDSLWMVVDQTGLAYCSWKVPGQAACAPAAFVGCDGPRGEPIRMIDPVNLGARVMRTTSWNPTTGRVDTIGSGVEVRVVEAKDFVPDRAIWVLNGMGTSLYRCSIGEGPPVCRIAAM